MYLKEPDSVEVGAETSAKKPENSENTEVYDCSNITESIQKKRQRHPG